LMKQIAGWIVINEPENILRQGYVSEEAMRLFVREVSLAIKNTDKDQRVGIADMDIHSMVQFADIDTIDFLVFHDYEDYLPLGAELVQKYLSMRLFRDPNKPYPKPIFFGEFDLDRPVKGKCDPINGECDLNKFAVAVRGLGYAGAWPYSLHNDTHTDLQTDQFDLVTEYVASMTFASSSAVSNSSDRTHLCTWITGQDENKRDIVSVNDCIIAVEKSRDDHHSAILVNEDWEAKSQYWLAGDEIYLQKLIDRRNERAEGQAPEPAWQTEYDKTLSDKNNQKSGGLSLSQQKLRQFSYYVGEENTELDWLAFLLKSDR
jgi:hypothetical protein